MCYFLEPGESHPGAFYSFDLFFLLNFAYGKVTVAYLLFFWMLPKICMRSHCVPLFFGFLGFFFRFEYSGTVGNGYVIAHIIKVGILFLLFSHTVCDNIPIQHSSLKKCKLKGECYVGFLEKVFIKFSAGKNEKESKVAQLFDG